VSAKKIDQPNSAQKQELQKRLHEKLAKCYQCGKCTAGCPMAFMMDIKPSEVVRLAQMGRVDELLKARSIWNCVSCHTCATRCPQGFSVTETMDALRSMAYEKGICHEMEKNTVVFHREFLGLVKSLGRLSEPWLVAFYKMGSFQFLNDVGIGMKMGLSGKLNPIPEKVEDTDNIKRIFERCGM
jgi:heterodisulfide reductase subunit C